MKSLRLILSFALLLNGAAWAEPSEMPDSAERFSKAIGTADSINEHLIGQIDSVLAMDTQIQQAKDRITDLGNELKQLDQEAENAVNDAQNSQLPDPTPPMADNSPPGSGSGGGGSGAGGGGGGGGMEGMKPPELNEAQSLQLPRGIEDVTPVAGEFEGGGAIAPSSGFDPTTGAFTLPSLKSPTQQLSGPINPAEVAAGNLKLTGAGKIPSSIQMNQNAAGGMPTDAMGPAGNGGMPMLGGGGVPASASDGGDSFSSVGAEEPEDAPTKLAVESMQTGTGGDGGSSESSGSVTGDADESPVSAQRSRNGDLIVVSTEKKFENPEARGLMTWVGFVSDNCRGESKERLSVCKGPLTEQQKVAVADETPVERTVASEPLSVAPAAASVGPSYLSKERPDNILELLGAK